MLPTEKREKIHDLSKEIILLYGEPKIGKSSLAAQFPDALFLSTEKGLNHLEVFEQPIKDWKSLLATITALCNEKNNFKTIVIDTTDNLALYCQDHVLKENGADHESELGFGRGWKLVDKEFRKAVDKLSRLSNKGMIFISHSIAVPEVRKGTAEGKTKISHTLSPKMRKVIHGMADMIWYMETDFDGNRVIRTKGTRDYDAGDRSNLLPPTIQMGKSANEGYRNILGFYYGGENGQAREVLTKRIFNGITHLAENKIDGFENANRVDNSVKKHLGDKDHEVTLKTYKDDKDIPIEKLELYVRHLLSKNNGGKK